MKLKRWIYPIISVLITLAILGLTGLLVHILGETSWAIIIVIVLFSNIWFALHPVLEFIYAYKCLKDCKFKVFFIFYSSILLTLPIVISIFCIGEGMAIPISILVFIACTFAGFAGSMPKKQIQPPHEYTEQFKGVSMEDVL